MTADLARFRHRQRWAGYPIGFERTRRYLQAHPGGAVPAVWRASATFTDQ